MHSPTDYNRHKMFVSWNDETDFTRPHRPKIPTVRLADPWMHQAWMLYAAVPRWPMASPAANLGEVTARRMYGGGASHLPALAETLTPPSRVALAEHAARQASVSAYKSAPVSAARREWERMLCNAGLIHIPASAELSDAPSSSFLPLRRAVRKANPDRAKFDHLAKVWKDETWAFSFPERKAMHRAYLQIIAMGDAAIPLILESLRARGPDHWFLALNVLTDANPAAGAETMEAATEAWLAWGDKNGWL